MIVFVYGTLKQGHHNHTVMQEAGGELIGPGVVSGSRMISLGGFPGLVECDDLSSIVTGELYEVDDVRPLDSLEGYRPHLDEGMYLRRTRTVTQPDGTEVVAFVYVWNGEDHYPEVANGTW